MTGTKNYDVRGANVTITALLRSYAVQVDITVDLSKLDADEPDHSEHNLIEYINLAHYNKGQSYWWCKLHRTVITRTGSQANRVIKHALSKIDDAISAAIIARDARKSEMQIIFA